MDCQYTSGRFPNGRGDSPEIKMGTRTLPFNGRFRAALAELTPGIALILTSASRKKMFLRESVGYFAAGRVTCMVRTPRGSKPESTRPRSKKLRINKLAPLSNIMDRAP